MFSQVLFPPFAMGITWSKVRSSVRNLRRQYWHRNPSRVKILIRENFTERWASRSLTIFNSRMTAGSLKEIETPWISRS